MILKGYYCFNDAKVLNNFHYNIIFSYRLFVNTLVGHTFAYDQTTYMSYSPFACYL